MEKIKSKFGKAFLKIAVLKFLVIQFICPSIAQSGCVDKPTDMVSWWPGDGNAQDIEGGSNGTLQNGVTFKNGMVDKAFYFDGIDDFVLIQDTQSLDITGDVTVVLWAKRTGFGGFGTLVSKGGGFIPEDVPTVFNIRFIENQLEVVFEPTNTSMNEVLTGPEVLDTNFHFYAYVRNGNLHDLYLDDNMVASNTFSEPPASTSGLPFTIGAQREGNNYSNFFTGAIDEIKVFNRALSVSEILSIYNAGSEGICKQLTGLNETFQLEKNLVLYPNPFQNSFTIERSGKFKNSQKLYLEIFDLSGKQIKKIDNLNDQKTLVDLKELNSGVFIYFISGDRGTITGGKIIKE